MPQTIQLDFQVDPSQVQSAITRVHQGVATGAQVGSMHAGGAMQGLGQMFGIGGSAGGARQIPTQIAPMNAVNVRQNNAVLPFQQASHNMQGMMARATAVSSQIAQRAMINHADAILPPAGNFRRVEAAKSAYGVAESLATFAIGSKLGNMIAPGPVGTIGGGLLASIGVPLIKKITGMDVTQNRFIEETFNGGNALPRPGTAAYNKEVQTRRSSFELGSTFLSYGGITPGGSGYKKQITAGMNLFRGIMGKMPDSYGSEIKGYMTYLAASGNRDFQDLSDKFVSPGFQLTKNDPLAGKLGALLKNVKNQSHMMQITPTQMAMADHTSKYLFTVGSGRRGPSRWSMMGKSFGQQMGLGKKWGKQAIYAMRGRARTDLGLSSEEKKMIGGSYGAAGMMASSMGASYSAGGLGYTQLAAWKGGAGADVGILDIGGYAAKATSTVGGYVDFVAGRKEQMKGMGGDAMYAQHRSHYMQMVQNARENYPSLRGKSNKDILTTLLISEEGLPDLKAHAKAAMILGIGERYTGGGSGLHALSVMHTRTGLAAPLARMMSAVTGTRISEEDAKRIGGQRLWSANTNKVLTAFTGKGWHTSGVKIGKLSRVAKEAWSMTESRGFRSDKDKSKFFMGVFAAKSKGIVPGMTERMRRSAGGAIIQGELARGEGAFTGGFDSRMLSTTSFRNIGSAVMMGAMRDPAAISRVRAYNTIHQATSKTWASQTKSMQRILRFQKEHKTSKDFVAIRDAALNMGDDRTAADAQVFIAGKLGWRNKDVAVVRRDAMRANAARKKVADDDFGDDISDTKQLVQGVQNIMKIVNRQLNRKQKTLGRSNRR